MFLFGGLGGMEENKKSLRESRLRAKKTTPAEFRACNGAEIAP